MSLPSELWAIIAEQVYVLSEMDPHALASVHALSLCCTHVRAAVFPVWLNHAAIHVTSLVKLEDLLQNSGHLLSVTKSLRLKDDGCAFFGIRVPRLADALHSRLDIG